MLPTEILSNEHRVIEKVLTCLDRIAGQAEATGRLEAEPAKDAIAFFRNFADRCHHNKEEVHLFPAMEAHGFPRESGPTGVMLYEHDEGRRHVRGMDESVEAAAAGDAKAVEAFCGHARAYIDLLQSHIEKEDHCLYSMANQAFSDEDQQRLLRAFEHVESDEMGAGTHDKYLGIARALCDRYGVPQVAAAAGGCCGCHCGH